MTDPNPELEQLRRERESMERDREQRERIAAQRAAGAQGAAAARPRRRKPSAFPVAAGSAAAFLGLFGFLAYQLRTGHDPALGNKVAATAAPVQKRVVLKRIEDHIIVTKIIPSGEGDDGGSAPVQVAAVPSGSTSVQQAPVVVQSTPAPAGTAAPAPVQTRTS